MLRFIHTADWHVGKPFAKFPADVAAELSAARLSVISRVAAIARAQGADRALVAGDIFDGERLAGVMVRRTLEHLRAESDVVWYLLPGNHDAARPGGLWERVLSIGLPENVVVCLDTRPVELAPGAVLLPSPLTSKAPGRDPSAWMDKVATAAGELRVGLAHGSVQGFGSSGESSVPIAPDRAARAGLAYLALGDWHGARRIDARTWYSGTPEPDRYSDNEPGHVLAVTLENRATPQVEMFPSGHFTWAKRAATISSSAALGALEEMLSKLVCDPQRLLVRLELAGALTFGEHALLQTWRERLEGRVRHLDVDTRALLLAAGTGDTESLGADSILCTAAEELAATASAPAHRDCGHAKRALELLFAFAAQAHEPQI